MIERVTAAESEDAQRRIAGALHARGLRRGDRVAVVAAPSATYLATALGALRTGIVPVLLNPALTEHEQTELLDDADPALVLRDTDLPALLGGAPIELAPAPLARPMMYTSGTTGRPKGVWTGVLDEDLRSACLAALQLDRGKVRAAAAELGWETAARLYLSNIENALFASQGRRVPARRRMMARRPYSA